MKSKKKSKTKKSKTLKTQEDTGRWFTVGQVADAMELAVQFIDKIYKCEFSQVQMLEPLVIVADALGITREDKLAAFARAGGDRTMYAKTGRRVKK